MKPKIATIFAPNLLFLSPNRILSQKKINPIDKGQVLPTHKFECLNRKINSSSPYHLIYHFDFNRIDDNWDLQGEWFIGVPYFDSSLLAKSFKSIGPNKKRAYENDVELWLISSIITLENRYCDSGESLIQ